MNTHVDTLVAKLEAAMGTIVPEDLPKAASLLKWYAAKGDLTEKQCYLAKAILKRKREALSYVKKEAPYFVYLLSDGEYVKIGYSKNPKKRRKAVQSGNPRQIKLVAKKEVAGRNRALAIEQSLHKQYGKYRKVGEWFCGSILDELKQRF